MSINTEETNTIEKVITYVMTTLTNTNPAILKQLLDEVNNNPDTLDFKDQIIDYVMYSIENTNPAMLLQMLKKLEPAPSTETRVGTAIVGESTVAPGET